MIALDNGDAIRGDASAANELDYILSGLIGTVATQLADGQIAAAEADLYLAGAGDIAVTQLTIVNTGAVARTINIYLKPNAGTSRRIVPKDLSLGIGYSLTFDGQRITIMDASGNILYSITQVLGNLSDVTLAGEADHDMLYYDNATSLWKNTTPAIILAQLSAQAGATFDFNAQVVNNIANMDVSSSVRRYSVDNDDLILQGGIDTYCGRVVLHGKNHATEAGAVWLETPNAAKSSNIKRLDISGAIDIAVATWANITQVGLKLGGSLDCASQIITGTNEGFAIGDSSHFASNIHVRDITGAAFLHYAGYASFYLLGDSAAAAVSVFFQTGTGAAQVTRLSIAAGAAVTRIQVAAGACLNVNSGVHDTAVLGDLRISGGKLNVFGAGGWEVVTSA